MDQAAALRATVALAEHLAMPERPGCATGLAHLRQMLEEVESSDMSAAKLGRWLGWAQCALVAADIGVALDDMRALNSRHVNTALEGAIDAGI